MATSDDSLRAAMDRIYAEVLQTSDVPSHLGEAFGGAPDPPRITVHHMSGYVPASLELLVDTGAITEDEARARGWTPPPRPSRRDRLRWRWQAWRERIGRKLGGWIAGVDLSERDEDW